MTQKHYAVDFDDVLCDFVPALLREVGKKQGRMLDTSILRHWLIADIVGSSLDELYQISEDSDIFSTLSPRKELSVVKDLHNAGHKITVVTNRFRVSDVDVISKSWLTNNGLGNVDLIFAEKKGKAISDIGAHEFADDCLLNALDVAIHCSDVKVWLPNRPWNGETEIRRIAATGKYRESVIRELLSSGRITRISTHSIFSR